MCYVEVNETDHFRYPQKFHFGPVRRRRNFQVRPETAIIQETNCQAVIARSRQRTAGLEKFNRFLILEEPAVNIAESLLK